ncbi:hypothetical protein [Deinococcus navajonensis]|uniref:Uncharacterized protein n=1 Tax=Deinococcus navajonensis TaxID=309884 RepID=A0ABV8XKR3_9DEIO
MTRAPLKLSREMKILLVLLLMVALIGLWYVLTGNRNADEAVTTPPAAGQGNAGAGTPAAGSGTGTDNGGQASSGSAGTGQDTSTPGSADTTPLSVAPDGPVDVEVIPPFPVNEAGDVAAGEVTAPPAGINPNTVLAGVPGSNPFRPLRLEAAGDAGAGTSGTPAPSGSSTGAVTPVPSFDTGSTDTSPLNSGSGSNSASTPGSGSTNAAPATASNNRASGNSGLSSGPVAITPVPGAQGSISVPSATVTGGVLPPPTIPGADNTTGGTNTSGAAPTVTIRPGGSVSPLPGGTGNATGTPSASAQGGTATTPAARPPAPPRPPVAGVQVPSVAQVPTIPGAAGNPATGSAGAGETGTNATGSASTGVGDVPAITTPQVITELGATGAGTATTVPNAPSALEQLVQTQNLAFNAVVLGPVNTAIFRSRDGFVVVSVGQKLPDTNVTVKEVTATSATLALGNDTKTLELDKR